MNEYKHLPYKHYESPFGYRWVYSEIPDWLSVEIHQEGDTKKVFVRSRIHKDKYKQVHPSYSSDWSDTDILKDIAGEIHYRYIM